MRFRHTMVAASLAALAFASAPASATVTVTIQDIVGSWQLAVPAPPTTTITNGNPTSTISWGNPAAPNTQQSAYQFTALGPLNITLLPPVSSGPELFGSFEHLNFPIFCDQTFGCLQSVELKITADIVVDSVDEGTKTFLFDFTHDETPNGGQPGGPFSGTCPFPTPGSPNGIGININGCADHVTVTNSNSSQTFTVNGVQYTLSFLGFSQDGGVTTTPDFLTVENETNLAGLYATVTTATVQTPEPGSLALVGLAALGVAGALRRRSQK